MGVDGQRALVSCGGGHTLEPTNGVENCRSSSAAVNEAGEVEIAWDQHQVDFGILFDVDGVVARGSTVLPPSIEMIKLLLDKKRSLRVPIAFVTNACSLSTEKAERISKWLDVKISSEQVIHAQSPLAVFTKYQKRRVLVVGQGDLKAIAAEVGFTNVCMIDEVKEAFPLLDVVDHANRRMIAQRQANFEDVNFAPIEAIVLMGEPDRWETYLQLLIDLLLTNGHPRMAPEGSPTEHIPVLACNMDLVFMAEACMPRFGHGAFLVCLESLYKKITGRDLTYTSLIGKPSEITFRYAEHCISEQAKLIGIEGPIKKLYFVGDNPEVDVFGANLYDQYLQQVLHADASKQAQKAASRVIPPEAEFNSQTVERCEAILVETGVYNPQRGRIEDNLELARQEDGQTVYHHGHRDFETDHVLLIPSRYAADIHEAVKHVLQKEGILN